MPWFGGARHVWTGATNKPLFPLVAGGAEIRVTCLIPCRSVSRNTVGTVQYIAVECPKPSHTLGVVALYAACSNLRAS